MVLFSAGNGRIWIILLANYMELADCYRLLGLRTGASYEDIKASYRRLARRYHPDANPTNQQQAKDKFIQLTEAYRRLISVVQPAQPDIHLAANRQKDRTPVKPPTSDKTRASASSSPQPPPPPPATASHPPQQKKRKPPPIQLSPDLTPVDRQLKQTSYEQLQQFLREGRFPRAIAIVEGLAQRLPSDVEVRQWQAITYQRFGRHLIQDNQPDKAKLYLKKALRTDPHNKFLWYEVDRDLRRIDQVEVL